MAFRSGEHRATSFLACGSQIDRPHRGQGGSFYFLSTFYRKRRAGLLCFWHSRTGRCPPVLRGHNPWPPALRADGEARAGEERLRGGKRRPRERPPHPPRGSGNRIFNVLNKPRSPWGKVKSVTNVHGENCPHAPPGRPRFAPAEGTGPSVSCGCDSGSFGQSGQRRLCPRPLP